MKYDFVTLGFVILLAALGLAIDTGFALIAIDRLAQSEGYTDIQVIPATDLPIRYRVPHAKPSRHSLRGRKVSDIGCGLASCLAFLFVHFLGRNSFDRFLLLAGKPIGHTHDNAEKAKAEYNHHDVHNAAKLFLLAIQGCAC